MNTPAYTRTGNVLAFTGLHHLSGLKASVRVTAKEAEGEYFVVEGEVSATGTLSATVPDTYATLESVQVGFPYTARVRTLDYGGQEQSLKAFTRKPVELTLLGSLGTEFRMVTNVGAYKALPKAGARGHTQGIESETAYNAEVTVEHSKPEGFQVKSLVLKTEYDTADLPNQRSRQ